MKFSTSAGIVMGLMLLALPAHAIDIDKLTINGYTSFEFEKQWERTGSGKGDPNASFDAGKVSLVFNFQASDRIRLALDTTYEHGPITEEGRGNVGMEYGFVEYTVSDLLRFRGGKMLTPFGIFNEIHDAKPAFLAAREALSTTKPSRIVKEARVFYPRWGAGLAIQGDGEVAKKRFDYIVLISNGDETTANSNNPYEKDDNYFKATTARFRFEPSDSMRIGTSIFYDRFANKSTAPFGTGFRSVLSNGLEFEWSGPRWRLLAEGIYGTFAGRTGVTSIKQSGGFLQPSVHLTDKVTLYTRYDWINANKSKDADTGAVSTLGVNFEISKLIFKIQNDYFHGGRGSDFVKYPGRDYNELKAYVSIGF